MIGKIACFNDLSIQPLCQTEADAAKRIKDFVLLLREVRSHTGITKIRHAGDISKIQLTSGMTMMDYCSRHIHNPEIAALIWTIIQPQVDMDDDHTLTSYLETTTEINLPNGGKQIADGFNAAYCQQTFCIGFDSAPVWRNDFFDISVTSNGKIRQTQWACISSLDFYGTNPVHTSRKPAFDRWLEGISPVNLIESTMSPDIKPINLSDDHGKDKLTAHAKLLRQSPYVEGILSSLEFQPTAKRYIWKITDDGIIDIVLWQEPGKYSMRLKTTGRNAAETKAIAEILKKKYGNK